MDGMIDNPSAHLAVEVLEISHLELLSFQIIGRRRAGRPEGIVLKISISVRRLCQKVQYVGAGSTEADDRDLFERELLGNSDDVRPAGGSVNIVERVVGIFLRQDAWLCSLALFKSSASVIFSAFLIFIFLFLFLPDSDELAIRSHLDLDLLSP